MVNRIKMRIVIHILISMRIGKVGSRGRIGVMIYFHKGKGMLGLRRRSRGLHLLKGMVKIWREDRGMVNRKIKKGMGR